MCGGQTKKKQKRKKKRKEKTFSFFPHPQTVISVHINYIGGNERKIKKDFDGVGGGVYLVFF